MTKASTYEAHLRAVLDAFFDAVPSMTAHQFCRKAGLSKNWLWDFRTKRRASLRSAEKALAAVRENCPTGERGERVRQLLAMLNPADLEDAA